MLFAFFVKSYKSKLRINFMNSTQTLKLNKDFKRLYYRGKCFPARCVVVYVQKNRFGSNRLGLTCGKSIGKAVKRNRAKRLMRASFQNLNPCLKQGYDIVVVARTRITEKKCPEVTKDMHFAFSKLDMLI